jgi:EAL domain-containing protein (putative c-di-GMP-specific phosphodiesterase class I)
LGIACTPSYAVNPGFSAKATNMIESLKPRCEELIALRERSPSSNDRLRNVSSTHRLEGKRSPSNSFILRKILAASQLDLHYQPIIEIPTRRLIGFEGLIRLQGKQGVCITPNEMLPLFEKLDLMNSIGSWVIDHACHTASRWPAGISIAVNIGSAQFKNGSLYESVRSALKESDLAPGRLELEVTEGVLLNDSYDALAQLAAVQALGCSIAMDDFGTGYSSLTQLRLFPFDRIKVDRLFTHDLPESAKSLAILRAVIGLGRSLNIAVTAEGVETFAQMRMLAAEGCDSAQGYLIGKPVDSRECEQLLKRLLDASGLDKGGHFQMMAPASERGPSSGRHSSRRQRLPAGK